MVADGLYFGGNGGRSGRYLEFHRRSLDGHRETVLLALPTGRYAIARRLQAIAFKLDRDPAIEARFPEHIQEAGPDTIAPRRIHA